MYSPSRFIIIAEKQHEYPRSLFNIFKLISLYLALKEAYLLTSDYMDYGKNAVKVMYRKHSVLKVLNFYVALKMCCTRIIK